MIQRIQSIFLLISLIAWGLLFFNPVMGFTDGAGKAWELNCNGISESAGGKLVLGAIPMLVLFVLTELLAVVAFFSYSRRALQLRATVLGMMLQILSYGIILVYTLQGKAQLDAKPQLLFWTIMPLIAAVSSYFAFRGIRRDILLLRAQDRLR